MSTPIFLRYLWIRALFTVVVCLEGAPLGGLRYALAFWLERRLRAQEDRLLRRGYCCLCGCRLIYDASLPIAIVCCPGEDCPHNEGVWP